MMRLKAVVIMRRKQNLRSVNQTTWLRISIALCVCLLITVSACMTNEEPTTEANMTQENSASVNLCVDHVVPAADAETANTIDLSKPFTITSDVILPSYSSLEDVPFSDWERLRSQELLEANGFEASYSDAWREAAQHSSMLIREAAYLLLIQTPDSADLPLFCQGQHDLSESVQALSAYALYQLGDQAQQAQLQRLVQEASVEFAVLRAAGLLGALGDPSPFGSVLAGLEQEKSAGTRIAAAETLFYFVEHQGQPVEPTGQVDVWAAYATALADPHENVRYVAQAQLKELNMSEGNKLLE